MFGITYLNANLPEKKMHDVWKSLIKTSGKICKRSEENSRRRYNLNKTS